MKEIIDGVEYNVDMHQADLKHAIHNKTGGRFAQYNEHGQDIAIYIGQYGLVDGYTLL